MQRILLKSKIHRATVTAADVNYEGSVSVDALLLEAADIVEHEQVQIYDIANGSRLTTYAIPAEPGSGVVQINGAAARLVRKGDLVIIASYAQYADAEARAHTPRVILVDVENRFAEPVAAGSAPTGGAPASGAPASGAPARSAPAGGGRS